MKRASIAGAFRAQNLCRLAGKGCKLHIAIHMLGKIAGERCLARTRIAEQSENRAAAVFEPLPDGLQRLILFR
ncbi:hypothetical protein D3C80_2056730 [compost metagenome]